MTIVGLKMVGLKAMQKRLSAIGNAPNALSAQSAKAFITLVQTVKPTVFWEVGKTIGAYSWLALEHSTTCKAILFEANPDHYSTLLKTINNKQLHRADAKNIVVAAVPSGMPACVDATAAIVEAQPRRVSCQQETIAVAEQRDAQAMASGAIATLTLDELLAQGYPSPDIIKLETQAVERLVMEGARQVLETCSPVLIVKTASPHLVRYLEGLSYRSFPFDQDNLIFISVYF